MVWQTRARTRQGIDSLRRCQGNEASLGWINRPCHASKNVMSRVVQYATLIGTLTWVAKIIVGDSMGSCGAANLRSPKGGAA